MVDMTPRNDFVLAPNLEPAHFSFPPAVETVAASLPQYSRPGDPLPVAIRWQHAPVVPWISRLRRALPSMTPITPGSSRPMNACSTTDTTTAVAARVTNR